MMSKPSDFRIPVIWHLTAWSDVFRVLAACLDVFLGRGARKAEAGRANGEAK